MIPEQMLHVTCERNLSTPVNTMFFVCVDEQINPIDFKVSNELFISSIFSLPWLAYKYIAFENADGLCK